MKIKSILTTMFVVYFVFCCQLVGNTATTGSLKYTMSVTTAGNTMKYTISQKGKKMKMDMENMVNYVDNVNNEVTTYIPKTKQAIVQSLGQQNFTEAMAQGMDKVKASQNDYVKVGPKFMNGYACTFYKNDKNGDEVCASDIYGIAIYAKTQGSVVNVTSVSNAPLADSEFQLPAGAQVQRYSDK